MNTNQRNHLVELQPYVCARDLYKTGIFLDANENYRQWVQVDWSRLTDMNRYPDSTADTLRGKLIEIYTKGFVKENIFIGAGSDEIIDLLIRGFVDGKESVMMMYPSYSVYEVQAEINNVQCKKVLLKPDFSLDIDLIQQEIKNVKLLFICSPNNPTGNLITPKQIEEILSFYNGLLVIDEAYIEFAGMENSFEKLVKENPQVIILRTFSKAWGLAGIRLGYCLASQEIIQVLHKIKDSYNTSKPSQEIALQALEQIDGLKNSLDEMANEKKKVTEEVRKLGYEVLDTKANFILIRIPDAARTAKSLAKEGIIVRDRSNLPYLENIVRMTIGSPEENTLFINALKTK